MARFNLPEAPKLDLITITRIFQALFAIIALGLNASVIDYYNTYVAGPTPKYLIFLVFTSVFTILLSIPYTTFAPRYFPDSINRWASLVVELLTTLFWFCGFIAGAVWLGKIDFCVGIICNNAKAGVIFSALVFLCYAITSYFPITYCFFDKDDLTLGDRKWAMGVSGTERITRARSRRDAANSARINTEKYGEHAGAGSKVKGVMETVKIRCGNVMDEWKLKAGRGRENMV